MAERRLASAADIAAAISASEAVGAARHGLSGLTSTPRQSGDPPAAAWVVGGALRDAALGRAIDDVDLAVAGVEPGRAAGAIASPAGATSFRLSSPFDTWRVIDPAGRWSIDLTALRGEPGDIGDDLRLRDFTLNAVAIPLGGGETELIDPSGGLDDLAAGRLRAVSQRSFADDPLRLLRAARLTATLGVETDPGTLELGRREAARAAEPAGERQLAELRGLISGERPLAGLAALDALGATAQVLPELEALKGLEQNPNHHLDAHGHTLEVLARLLEIEAELEAHVADPGDADRLRTLLAEPLADEMSRGEALRFGALVHDWGKPATRDERDGWVIFPGHDREGARIVGAAMRRLRASRALCRHLQALTLHHLRLGFLAAQAPLSPRELYAYLATTAPVAADVSLLTVADRLSARGGGATASERMIDAHLELAREVSGPALDWHFAGPPAAPLDGSDLLRLGVRPGPRIGEILAELAAASFAGEIEDAAAAEARVRELAGPAGE